MKNKPILFSGAMIKAILAGSKTQTRRIITRRNSYFDGAKWPNWVNDDAFDWAGAWVDQGPSPAGNPGPYLKLPWTSEETVHRIYPVWIDRPQLWVRESVWLPDKDVPHSHVTYRADHGPDKALKWMPAIHMPRWASRITLEITSIRVERLQDISKQDVIAEGLTGYEGQSTEGMVAGWHQPFAQVWEEINGLGSWEANPWVWALTFKRVV